MLAVVVAGAIAGASATYAAPPQAPRGPTPAAQPGKAANAPREHVAMSDAQIADIVGKLHDGGSRCPKSPNVANAT